MELNAAVVEGLIECIISSVFFGSAYVPVKRFKYGDGIFLLQIRSISILCFGFATFAYTGFTHFYPLALVGGVIWTIANLIILPCIAELGLGIAVLLYSFTNCLTNYFTGNFGLFWTNARPPENYFLNYLGLVGLLIGGATITLIKPEKKQKLSTVSIISTNKMNSASSLATDPPKTKPKKDRTSVKRIIAIVFALLSGFMFGEDPTPIIVLQDRFDNTPKHGLYYIFSFYFGIFLTSSIVFAIYCVVKKNKPFVNAELALASLFSGAIWAVAQGLFIICMGKLSISIAGPIASIMPGCVAAMWSVFFFKEIKGQKNLLLLCASISITSIGTILIAFSK